MGLESHNCSEKGHEADELDIVSQVNRVLIYLYIFIYLFIYYLQNTKVHSKESLFIPQ